MTDARNRSDVDPHLPEVEVETSEEESRTSVDLFQPGWLSEESQRLAIAVTMAFGVALLWPGLGGDAGITPYYGSFLTVYAGIVLMGLIDLPFIGPRFEAFLDEWVNDLEKGFYGLLSLSVFIFWELRLLVRRVAPFVTSEEQPEGGILGALLSFGIESFLNALTSLLWPFILAARFGIWEALLFGLTCWAFYWLGTRLFTTPVWLLEND